MEESVARTCCAACWFGSRGERKASPYPAIPTVPDRQRPAPHGASNPVLARKVARVRIEVWSPSLTLSPPFMEGEVVGPCSEAACGGRAVGWACVPHIDCLVHDSALRG